MTQRKPVYRFCFRCGKQLTWFTYADIWDGTQYLRLCWDCARDRKTGYENPTGYAKCPWGGHQYQTVKAMDKHLIRCAKAPTWTKGAY